jgi:D-alanyl-lipoteichoic acid acyltransferase DltB (MBOAT superfamily)
MIFTTTNFIVFLLATVVLFYLCTNQGQRILLLAANYVFYMWMKPVLGLFLLAGTVVTYFAARAIQEKVFGLRKVWTALGVVLMLGQLAVFKYADFFLSGVGLLLGREIPGLDLLLPIGISFYSFASAGYLFDVQRGKMEAERSFIDCALFLSFFPSIMSGPIPRGRELLPQFKYRHDLQWEPIRKGVLRFTWGAMKKMVIADTIVGVVNTAYAAPDSYTGGQLLFAVILYSLYIYLDFSSYTDMAIGAGWMLGFTLPENFDAPYTARTVQGFWKRWHISLTSWFKEYLFIPLGGSRVAKWRLFLNILIVFAVSGLWHGAAITFVVWGLLNGVYQVIGQLTKGPRDLLKQRLRIKEHAPLLVAAQIFLVFAFITAAWVFFRADSLDQAMFIIKRILLILRDGFGSASLLDLGVSGRRLAVAGVCFIPVVVEDVRKARGAKPLGLEGKPYRYCISLALLLILIAVFGAYGEGFDQSEFVYFKF